MLQSPKFLFEIPQGKTMFYETQEVAGYRRDALQFHIAHLCGKGVRFLRSKWGAAESCSGDMRDRTGQFLSFFHRILDLGRGVAQVFRVVLEVDFAERSGDAVAVPLDPLEKSDVRLREIAKIAVVNH